MKTFRNLFLAALTFLAFSCKNSSHDTDDEATSGETYSTDENMNTNAENTGAVDDTTSTGTTGGDNGSETNANATTNGSATGQTDNSGAPVSQPK